MREDELLGHIFSATADQSRRFPQVLVGPGDDCALVDIGASRGVVLKTDQVVEGRHFRGGTLIDLIARKAIARVVSDIAACGGTPIAGLAGAVLPHHFAQGRELFDAMHRWAAHWGCPLVGGDIASLGAGQDGPMVLTVSAIGHPHARRGTVTRSGARAGDVVYVTGALGGSFDAASGLGRHLTFEPRLAEAAWLCDVLGDDLHAMMDVSDGLGRDAGRLAARSGVKVVIDAERVPRAGVDWRRAMSDGEDHELLFCAPAGVPERCPATGTAVTAVGVVEAGVGCVVRMADGREIDALGMGWEH